MRETTHNLTQRAERWKSFSALHVGASEVISELSAALVQAEQEKADFHMAYRMECDTISKAALVRAEAAEARLASQEATIRQVAQEMLPCTGNTKIKRWADTLQAITGETQEMKTDVDDRKTRPRMTYETDAHCRRCANLRERHPVRMNLGDDPLGQTECAEFVPWPDAETKGEP